MSAVGTSLQAQATADAKACFLRACALDVGVRKPGNVSFASAGHGMQAQMFLDSAEAAAGPLFERGARVGERIEAAVNATWAAAGCNTNLGILLLCAPVARAVELHPDAVTPSALRDALEEVLADLNLADAEAAYRGIARAHPGGLGSAPSEDVNAAPSIGLRAAMALAAHRDRIARQYRDGYADLFAIGMPALRPGFSVMARSNSVAIDAAITASVQRLYLTLLASFEDSHIVRNRGEAVAQTVMTAAQGWLGRETRAAPVSDTPDFAAWDASLKAQRINPGTTADLTVATLLLAGLTQRD